MSCPRWMTIILCAFPSLPLLPLFYIVGFFFPSCRSDCPNQKCIIAVFYHLCFYMNCMYVSVVVVALPSSTNTVSSRMVRFGV